MDSKKMMLVRSFFSTTLSQHLCWQWHPLQLHARIKKPQGMSARLLLREQHISWQWQLLQQPARMTNPQEKVMQCIGFQQLTLMHVLGSLAALKNLHSAHSPPQVLFLLMVPRTSSLTR
ncbi:uncharacterized protein LOC143295834 isoform X2 [Babylonia areolata]|uniref:uncharacterized protein LOC143295834 isoform X2 n=1 Tax=Babylonia areolata TaxID=304850 RepID=UPI003FD6048B